MAGGRSGNRRHEDSGTGRLGDTETGRLGDWKVERLEDWEAGPFSLPDFQPSSLLVRTHRRKGETQTARKAAFASVATLRLEDWKTG